MNTSPSIIKIAPALLKAQKAMGSAKKGTENTYFHSKYADLGSVMEACKSALNDNGITVLQPIMGDKVETTLIHESGEFLTSETPIVVKEQNNPQMLGSAISYARRYGLQSMVFVPAEDDDANSATEHKEESKAPGRPYFDQSQQRVVTPAMLASEKQVQLISILLSDKGQTDEALYTKYNVKSKKELTKVQASQIIDNLSKLPTVEKLNIDEIPENLGSK